MNTFKFADNHPSTPFPPYDQSRDERVIAQEGLGKKGKALVWIGGVAAAAALTVGIAKSSNQEVDTNPYTNGDMAAKVAEQTTTHQIHAAYAEGETPVIQVPASEQ